MKRFRYLTIALIGTALYVLISLFFGQSGFWAARQMEIQKHLLSTHTAEIQKIHDQLNSQYNALEKDPDVISAYARKLGYISDGEKLVKITGLASKVTEIYDTGTVKRSERPVYVPEWFCKLFSLAVSLLLLIVVMLNDYRKELACKTRTRAGVKGVPVYDLPQV